MNTEKQVYDGYYLINDELSGASKMVLQGPWKIEYGDVILKKKITGLRLSDSNGWKGENIDFIYDLKIIDDLEIYSRKIKDILPIESLPQLTKIGLDCDYRTPIDFSGFTMLESLFLRWGPNSESVFSVSSLKKLNLINYPFEDLNMLHQLRQLNELKLVSTKIKRLSGADNLIALVSLDLYRCTKLESIDGVQSLSALRIFEIESCKKINSLGPLNELEKLKRVSINNCGKIQSLMPLTSSTNLSELFFIEDTNIEDGNVGVFSCFPQLQIMWFANRRHYSHKREDIQRELMAY